MPVYNLIENRIKQARRGADLPMLMTFCVRLVYVVLVTLVAVVIPFFGALRAEDHKHDMPCGECLLCLSVAVGVRQF
jgi:hypothetical protein